MERLLPPSARRDHLAAKLIEEFGSLPEILAASDERIRRVALSEPAASTVISLREAMLYTLRARTSAKPVIDDWQALLDYLHVALAHHATEQFRVLHLDTQNQLIRDEVMNRGSIDHAPVYVREVIHRALDFGSAAVILVHNHPSGDLTPSRSDIHITREIADAGKRLGIAVHDHLIIGAQGHTSLRSKGFI